MIAEYKKQSQKIGPAVVVKTVQAAVFLFSRWTFAKAGQRLVAEATCSATSASFSPSIHDVISGPAGPARVNLIAGLHRSDTSSSRFAAVDPPGYRLENLTLAVSVEEYP